MLTLSATLEAHSRGTRKKPTLRVTLPPTRFGVPFLRWQLQSSNADPSAPISAAIFESLGFPVLVCNNAGALEYSVPTALPWTNLDTVTAGQGFQLAYDQANDQVAVAYGDGNDLKFAVIGAGSPTTLLTEASPIGSVALAFDDNGDACAFYTLGTSTTLKRLRRTSGTWAVSGTTWSKSADAASLTGLSAIWATDYFLAITGTEVTTTHERLWTVAMGDTLIPANTWASFRNVAEADAAAALTFAHPSLCLVGTTPFLTFQQVEAGNVASSRLMLSHAVAGADPRGFWREPAPPAAIASSHGAALAYSPVGGTFLFGPSSIHAAPYTGAATDLSARVLSCTWRETPTSLKLRLELEDHDSGAIDHAALGRDVLVEHGFASDGDEFGITVRATIARVTRKFEPGKLTAVLECEGPWEAMARFHAPQAWTAPSGQTRSQVFQRVAGRAGVAVSLAAGDRAPSTAWTTDTPAFAIAIGENGRTTCDRLLAPTADFLRSDGAAGNFQVCGVALGEGPQEAYGLPVTSDAPHPLLSLTNTRELETNWLRVQGPDRYADAFSWSTGIDETPTPVVLFELLRSQDATADPAATAAAVAALKRAQLTASQGELVAPINLAHELYDRVETDIEHVGINGAFHIVGRGADFKRGASAEGRAGPVYNSTFQLGRL